MKELKALIARNTRLFFKDKAMFFTSLITPMILLVLYITFLGEVYRDAFRSGMPEGIMIPDKIIDGAVGGQLVSSLLAVSCVTVAFCANLLMIQDKVTGARRDFGMTPVKESTLSLGYFISTAIVTLIIGFAALSVSLIYLRAVGWYLSVSDVMLLCLDVLILTLFGTSLSSAINCLLSTNGQASAVGTIISSGYGFICGAYMPISSFGELLQRIVMFLPGTYGTALLRNHAMGGALEEMQEIGIPEAAVEGLRDVIDCNLYFFEKKVDTSVMYAVLIGATALVTLIYIAICKFRKKK